MQHGLLLHWGQGARVSLPPHPATGRHGRNQDERRRFFTCGESICGWIPSYAYVCTVYPIPPSAPPHAPSPPTPNPPPPCPSQVVSIQYQVIRDEFYNGTSRVRDVCTIHPGSGKECRESSTGRLGSTFRSSFLLPFPHYDFSTPDLTLPCSLLYVVGHGRTDYRVHL